MNNTLCPFASCSDSVALTTPRTTPPYYAGHCDGCKDNGRGRLWGVHGPTTCALRPAVFRMWGDLRVWIFGRGCVSQVRYVQQPVIARTPHNPSLPHVGLLIPTVLDNFCLSRFLVLGLSFTILRMPFLFRKEGASKRKLGDAITKIYEPKTN